jgi:predicted dehydrogenase
MATGHLGKVLAVDVIFRTGDFLDTSSPLDWRKDRTISGNNIIALGIWYETLMRWIGRASSVFALSHTGMATPGTGGSSHQDRVPDHLEVLARMENGALTRIQMSTLAGLDQENAATIYGSQATLQFRANTLSIGKKTDTALSELSIPASEEGRWNVEEDFIDAIRNNGEVTLTDFETGLAYMEFTDAVWMSLDEGRLVDLPLQQPANAP